MALLSPPPLSPQCEIVSLKTPPPPMLLLCSDLCFPLVLLMDIWLLSFMSQLVWLFPQESLCFHLCRSDLSLLCTLLCPEHTCVPHTGNSFKAGVSFNLQCPTWPLGQRSSLFNAFGVQESFHTSLLTKRFSETLVVFVFVFLSSWDLYPGSWATPLISLSLSVPIYQCMSIPICGLRSAFFSLSCSCFSDRQKGGRMTIYTWICCKHRYCLGTLKTLHRH